MERVEKADGEGTARSKPRPRRQIGVVVDLKTLVHALIGQDGAHRRVPDIGDCIHKLDLGIDDPRAMLEEGRQPAQCDVAIFVDGQAEHRAAVLAEPGRIIGPAAKQRYTKWSAADDHIGRTPLTLARLWSTRPSATARISRTPRRRNYRIPCRRQGCLGSRSPRSSHCNYVALTEFPETRSGFRQTS